METTSYPLSMDNIEDKIRNSDALVDELLKSFDAGWTARGKDDLERYHSRLKANIINTVTYLVDIFRHCTQIEIYPVSAFVKIIDPQSMAVVLAVGMEDYLKRSLLKLHGKTIDIEQSSRSEDYNVSFTVVCDYGSLNEETLSCEGFTNYNCRTLNNLKKNHALHNEKVCDLLHTNGQFSDWVVTTAFYSALHFVIHKIFPCTINNQIFTDFDSYYRTLGNNKKSQHTETITLVSRRCGREIGELYKFLHNTSWQARYTDETIPVEVANKCREYLLEIKEYSTRA